MARSMVSIGTDASRAFWNMVRRVAFVLTSPPPSRAATSTWRISLANNLPRALSCAPFLCLIVAHLLWPDIDRSTPFEEQLVDAAVVAQFRVERGDEDRPLPAQHRRAVDGGQYVDAVADPLDH